jgi:site-specific DNA-methyltransferase (adenine-specific)
MQPYYDQDGITLYHADCRDVLADLAPVALTLTDPPYNSGQPYEGYDDRIDPAAYQAWLAGIFRDCGRLAAELVYFPGTRNLLDVRAFLPEGFRPVRTLGWHRREFAGDKWLGGPAMCWEPVIWASRAAVPAFNRIYGPAGRDFLVIPSIRTDPYAKRHPCPKPLAVTRWLVGLFCPPGGTLLDPFAGSGAILRAAADLGRAAIGIEQAEPYCELIAERLAQRVLDYGQAAPAAAPTSLLAGTDPPG